MSSNAESNKLSRREAIQLAGAAGLSVAASSNAQAEGHQRQRPKLKEAIKDSRVPLESLAPEQQSFARQFQALSEKRKAWFLDTVEHYNGSREVEGLEVDNEKAFHKVSVSRGEVLEKAGWYTNYTRRADPPYIPAALWDGYFEVDFHPRTPLLGQLHATVYMSFMANGQTALSGYMDYTPGTWIDEDIVYMKSVVDGVFAKYGKDVEHARKMLKRGYHKEVLKAACIGAAFYLPPLLPVSDANLAFIEEVHTSFVGAYLKVLDRRKDQRFTNDDLVAQAGMRKRWLEDHMFADPITMHVVPYEVWSLADQAPTVHF